MESGAYTIKSCLIRELVMVIFKSSDSSIDAMWLLLMLSDREVVFKLGFTIGFGLNLTHLMILKLEGLLLLKVGT